MKIYQLKTLFFFIGSLFFFYSVLFASEDLPIIVVDPGHGMNDSGATGYFKTTEKEITLALANRFIQIASHKYHIILTHEKDTFKSLLDRTATANHHQALAFISLHVGASFRLESKGLATYYWQPSVGELFFESLSKNNNYTDRFSQQPPLWDYLQQYHLKSSKILAKTIHNSILSEIELNDRKITGAPIFILNGADMPAILIEIANIKRPKDENNLMRDAFLDKIVRGISRGLDQFIKKNDYGSQKYLQY